MDIAVPSPLKGRLDDLPIILAGPIVRRVAPDSVTVWVALRVPRNVSLDLSQRRGDGSGWDPVAIEDAAPAATLAIGKHLHVVAVTVRPLPRLNWGALYGYNLRFSLPMDFVDNAPIGDLWTPGILAPTRAEAAKLLTYAETLPGAPDRPSFVLPPDTQPGGLHALNGLRFLHGSCRKAHGEGYDALAGADLILKDSLRPNADKPRPQFLMLSGDQVYADDVADALLAMLIDAGNTLLGWQESLPGSTASDDFRPGQRSVVAKRIHLTSSAAASHLMPLAEFCAMYLFVWSDVLWPKVNVWPTYPDLMPPDQAGTPDQSTTPAYLSAMAAFREQVDRLKVFHESLPRVRRALANIATLMIFDDHEITDDWNLTREFCAGIYDENNPLARRVVMNGLLSYAVFQAWGNTPERFAFADPVPAGRKLLDSLTAWVSASGSDAPAEQRLQRLLDIPLYREGVWQRTPGSDLPVRWHYRVAGPGFELLVTDTRTARDFPGGPKDPPDLLPPIALGAQITTMPDPEPAGVTMVVLTTNLLGEPATEAGVEGYGLVDVYGPDKGDAWIAQSPPFERLLAALVERTAKANAPDVGRIVILSGDIHYAYAARLQYWVDKVATPPAGSAVGAVLASFTASSFKNEISKTRILHDRAFGQLGSRRYLAKLGDSQWVGWRKPIDPSQDIQYDLLRMSAGLLFGRRRGRNAGWSLHQNPSMCRLDDLAVGVKFSTPWDWSYRIDFVKDFTKRPESAVNIRYRSNPPPEWITEQTAALTKAYREYADHGHGRAVVGHTNIGDVSFIWNGNDKVAKQLIWWCLVDTADVAPLTLYQVSLERANSSYPKPTYPE